jgi:hypothetical protein
MIGCKMSTVVVTTKIFGCFANLIGATKVHETIMSPMKIHNLLSNINNQPTSITNGSLLFVFARKSVGCLIFIMVRQIFDGANDCTFSNEKHHYSSFMLIRLIILIMCGMLASSINVRQDV